MVQWVRYMPQTCLPGSNPLQHIWYLEHRFLITKPRVNPIALLSMIQKPRKILISLLLLSPGLTRRYIPKLM